MAIDYNNRGKSGITRFEIGKDCIILEFKGGKTYLYNHSKPGKPDVTQMKRLANTNEKDLNTYVSQNVKKNYSQKLIDYYFDIKQKEESHNTSSKKNVLLYKQKKMGVVVKISKNNKAEDTQKALAKLTKNKSQKGKLASFYGKLPGAFGDGLTYQKRMRNEWQ